MITHETQASHVDELIEISRLLGLRTSDLRLGDVEDDGPAVMFVLRLDERRIPRWLRAKRPPHRGLLRRMLAAVRNALFDPRPEPRYLPAAIARRLPRIAPALGPGKVPAQPLLIGPSADIPVRPWVRPPPPPLPIPSDGVPCPR